MNMLNLLSKNIAQFFCEKNIIPLDEINSYAYGYEIMIMSAINWGIIVAIMFVTESYLETISYISVIILMRHHTGGYHAETHLICGIISIASYIIVLFASACLPQNIVAYFIFATIFISFCIVFKYAPVEHKNNPVSKSSIKKHRLCSLIFFILFLATAIVFLYLNYYSLALSISLSLFQVSISILLGIHKNTHQKEGNSNEI